MPPPPPEALQPLDGELVLGESLGRGAMGAVFRARDRTSGREIALKILHAQTASAAERFLREARITAQLRHPGIVRIHSVGTYRGQPCLALEFVEGARSFEGAVQASPELAIPLLVQAAQALGAAHAKGLVHRDVKSDNLLVDPAGRLRVTDFGLVTGEDLSRLTLSGAWVGTPQTMAPEQFGAREAIGPATDVWALGTLLYWSLTGRYPVEDAGSVIEHASAITAGDFARPSKLAKISKALEAVCLKALSVDPEQRHADGQSFAIALEEASLAPAQAQRWPLLAAGVAGVALVAVGVLVLGEGSSPEGGSLASGTPRPSASAPAPPASVASPTPSPRDDALQAVLAWQEQSEAGSLLRPLVEARYLGANDNFRHLLFAAERDPGLGSVLRAARALLGGTGVVRDVEAALTFLRYGAGRGDRTCFVLLTDTLASEGQFEEELVWLGRFAIVQAHPLELHRIWRIARSEGPKASFAQRIWAGVEKDKLRGTVMDFVEGFKGKALDAPRAKGAERTEFLIALALEAWKHEPSLRHSFQLEVVLDSLAPADQLRLIQVGSPSRLLVELCLRRGDMALLNEALPPTLAGADETWLSGITQVLFERGMAPACADQIVARFALLDSQRAQRWVAVCQLTGWGTRKNPRAGSEALRRLAAAGDHQASVRLYEATARNPPNLTLGEELLREGVAADHPQSLLHFARLLARGDSSRKDEVRALARRASRARFPPAHLYLSRLVLASASGPKDLKTVRRLVGLASDQDYIAALERGASLEVAKPKGGSSGKATSCLRRAAWLGSGRAARRYAGAAVREEEAKAKPEYRSARRYLKRAIVMGKGDVLAVLALAKLDLKRRSLRAAAIRTLHDLARADPEGLGAVALGNLLYAEGDTLAGENLLARAALSRTEGLDNYLKILKGSGREREAAAFLQAGVRARRPVFLIKVARERFATDPAWAQRALLEAGKRRPQAHVILGRLLWDTGERENRLRAWKLWLSAEARRNKVALRNLSRLPWPK